MRSLVGRLLMTVAILFYGALPPFVDLSPTHALHPEWTPHSRMHLVWLVVTNSAIALVALYFLWIRSRDRALSIRLPGVLSLCVLGGFFLSAATHPLYGGALHDPGGVPPANVPLLGTVDGNLLSFSIALLFLIGGWGLAARSSAQQEAR